VKFLKMFGRQALIILESRILISYGISMLMLLFYVGDDRYALDSKRVVEVVPTVALKKLHSAPEYIPGLFNYRGHLVPVIDLCQMIQRRQARAYSIARIVLVKK